MEQIMEQIICKKCVMDKSAEEIKFDEDGICNFCKQAQKALKEIRIESLNLTKRIEQIKKDGNKYDCLIGLSGGVDSSTVLHYAIKLGLRPLCFSLDNGYNKPEANENIKNLVEKLEVPFEIYKIDLKKYTELQKAFFKAGIKNIEAITDHILFAVSYKLANKYKIKWIISGGNTATESVMPASWGEDPRDLYWIKSVYKKMTGKKLKGLPMISLLEEQYYRLIKGIKFFRLLDYYNYNRLEAEQNLIKNFKFQSTGGKHEENYLTWWYQSFFLYTKYGIDKRKAFYSSLINSGQMTRKEVMKMLVQNPVYPRLGIEEMVMKYLRKNYSDYPNSAWLRKIVIKLYKWAKIFQ